MSDDRASVSLDLPEAITSRTDTPTGPHVYALELDRPATWAIAAERWDAVYDVRPEWLRVAYDAAECYYVGAAANLSKRIRQHVDGHNRSAAIFTAFDIDAIAAVWPMETVEEAFERESQLALEWQAGHPHAFVRQA